MSEHRQDSHGLAFADWVTRFRQRALAAGIARDAVERFAGAVRINTDSLERDRAQPEFQLTASDYLGRAVTDSCVNDGREALLRHAGALAGAGAAFGVDARILAAIWGIESNFGKTRGEVPALDALATLAWSGRRPEYFEKELLAALRILHSGAADIADLKGSWAGAMGHTQFMPSSYQSDAVSLRQSGVPDIWGENPEDALASAGRFLSRRGWRRDLPWGGEAVLPDSFDFMMSGHWKSESALRWELSGVCLASAMPIAGWGPCSLFLPAGSQGPAFLTTANFSVLLRYNRSPFYALSVGLLADELGSDSAVRPAWPPPDRPLSRDQMMELQRRLAAAGYDCGGVDGIAGPATLRSVQLAQAGLGETPDGLPSRDLLARLTG